MRGVVNNQTCVKEQTSEGADPTILADGDPAIGNEVVDPRLTAVFGLGLGHLKDTMDCEFQFCIAPCNYKSRM